MSDWFLSQIRHTGKATLKFSDPPGTVTGEGFVEIDERGSITVRFRVEDYQLHAARQINPKFRLIYLLSGNAPFGDNQAISLAPNNTCTSFELESDEGIVRSGGSVQYILGNEDNGAFTVSVVPLWLQFDALPSAEATYWVMPLSNFVSGFLQSPSSRVELNPLLIRSGEYGRIIEFEFGGGGAFIGRLPDYDHRIKELQEGRAANRITSVMIGEVGDEMYDNFETLERWFPLHLLGVLSLATGSQVGSPWIELRDETGQLVRRFYTRATAPIYIPGYVAVDDALGLERVSTLLTAASQPEASKHLNASYLRVGFPR